MTETEALVKAEIEKSDKSFLTEEEDEGIDIATQGDIAFAKTLKEELSKALYGQDQAINVVSNSMKNFAKDEKGPKATYLF